MTLPPMRRPARAPIDSQALTLEALADNCLVDEAGQSINPARLNGAGFRLELVQVYSVFEQSPGRQWSSLYHLGVWHWTEVPHWVDPVAVPALAAVDEYERWPRPLYEI